MEADNESLLTAAYNRFLENEELGNILNPVGGLDPVIITNPQDVNIKAAVVGGFAMLLHGGRKDTKDLDFAFYNEPPISLLLEQRFKQLIKDHGDRHAKDKGEFFFTKLNNVPDSKRIGLDWLPVGCEFIRKPLYAEKTKGIWVVTAPNLAILKAKALQPTSQRGTDERDKDMKDFKFLLDKMARADQKIPENLKFGAYLLWNAAWEDPTASADLAKISPWPKIDEPKKGMWY